MQGPDIEERRCSTQVTSRRYWLDANVFIEAKNGILDFDIAPRFWIWLEEQLKAGVLCSSSLVYKEILGKDDSLAKWAKVRKGLPYWPEPDAEVQAPYREIVEYVENKYASTSPAKVGDFLSKADCWIIAHAKAKRGTVVTRESKWTRHLRLRRSPTFARLSMSHSSTQRKCSGC
jgi:hypothetical protein